MLNKYLECSNLDLQLYVVQRIKFSNIQCMHASYCIIGLLKMNDTHTLAILNNFYDNIDIDVSII